MNIFKPCLIILGSINNLIGKATLSPSVDNNSKLEITEFWDRYSGELVHAKVYDSTGRLWDSKQLLPISYYDNIFSDDTCLINISIKNSTIGRTIKYAVKYIYSIKDCIIDKINNITSISTNELDGTELIIPNWLFKQENTHFIHKRSHALLSHKNIRNDLEIQQALTKFIKKHPAEGIRLIFEKILEDDIKNCLPQSFENKVSGRSISQAGALHAEKDNIVTLASSNPLILANCAVDSGVVIIESAQITDTTLSIQDFDFTDNGYKLKYLRIVANTKEHDIAEKSHKAIGKCLGFKKSNQEDITGIFDCQKQGYIVINPDKFDLALRQCALPGTNISAISVNINSEQHFVPTLQFLIERVIEDQKMRGEGGLALGPDVHANMYSIFKLTNATNETIGSWIDAHAEGQLSLALELQPSRSTTLSSSNYKGWSMQDIINTISGIVGAMSSVIALAVGYKIGVFKFINTCYNQLKSKACNTNVNLEEQRDQNTDQNTDQNAQLEQNSYRQPSAIEEQGISILSNIFKESGVIQGKSNSHRIEKSVKAQMEADNSLQTDINKAQDNNGEQQETCASFISNSASLRSVLQCSSQPNNNLVNEEMLKSSLTCEYMTILGSESDVSSLPI